MPKSRLFLIDAHALCYRSFFAVKSLTTSYGQPTNAVVGFLNTLKKILKDYQPEYIAACFDVGKKTHRQERFSEYKVHRPSMPDDLISQIPLIKELVLAYNIPFFELEGFEADDVIATISRKAAKKDVEVMIVSGDKDMFQLVDDNIKIFDYRKGEIIDIQKAKDIYGFDPERMVDYIGLAGDKTDNIPGVMGIGKVTATQLIQLYGDLENILKNLDQLKSQKIAEKIRDQKDQAMMSKELAILDDRVPIDFQLKDAKRIESDKEQLFKLFQKLEFRKLAEEVSVPCVNNKKVSVKTLDTKKEINDLCQKIKKNKIFSFVINAVKDDLLQSTNVAVAFDETKVFFVSLKDIGYLKEVFESDNIIKVCHNVKQDLKALSAQSINLDGEIFDVLLAAYLLEPSQAGKDIASLLWKYLKVAVSERDDIGAQAGYLIRLFSVLRKELEEKFLLKLFNEIEIPLARVLFCVEREGVLLDLKFLHKLSIQMAKEIDLLRKKIYTLATEEFNLNSPKQLSYILFEKLKLPVIKKIKTGFSTNEDVLHRLAETHELPKLILSYRHLAKLTSTYVDALPKMVDPKTSRIHAEFDQAGTETGRLSSRNPNLQNIPIRTEFGRQIRKAFVARDSNHVILSADYSQIELRILAHLSKDKALIDAFKNGEDIHAFTAASIFNVKESEVDSEMRVAAKRVNFGIVYGISAFGLAKDLGVSQNEAQQFIDKYFLRYPDVSKFMQEEIQKAEKNGFVLTLLNRRRYMPEIHSDNMMVRQFAQRQAINTPVQGSAADLIKLAMINVQEAIEKKKLKSKMIITVHDELVFDILKSEKDQMVHLIKEQMESPLKLSVPIKVSIKIGNNWLETKEVAI
ncbi:MAG: DNA polymerase I [Candidatus Omnitrophica bacterium]|nr:DNA polymerase I [Candidatus Omnitrophota bacterium]